MKPVSIRPMDVKATAINNTTRSSHDEPAPARALGRSSGSGVKGGRNRRDPIYAQDVRELIVPPRVNLRHQLEMPPRNLRQGHPGVRSGDEKELLGRKSRHFRSDQ